MRGPGTRGPRRGRARHVVLGMAIAAVPVAARGADSWSISIGIRETGSSGAIGNDGGTSGAIEWVNLDGQSIIADGLWHQYAWNFGSDPVTNFSGGNGILSAANNKGVLEHIRIVNSGGNTGGAINLRVDDIVNTAGGTPTTIAGFETTEGFTTSLTSSQPMFREPIFSGTTLANMGPGINSTLVSTIPHSGSQSMAARWSFVPNGSTTQWLRMSTSNATVKPNPIVDFTSGNTLSMWMRASVTNPSGTRAMGIDVSSNQGTGIDWNRVAQPASTGGAGMSFAFIRATRGGTSGTSTTGSNRVDDSTWAYNIAGAKSAGLLTGPYHFGRPDLWTTDASGTVDNPATVGTPEDEARHYLEIAGKVMKPGYMRPVYDLEDGNEETTNTQLTSYVTRFADHIKKYKGTSAAIIVYAGSSYANAVNSPVAQYPLWMPRWPSDPNQWADDPFATESSYGVWNDGNPANPMPWSFWQFNSPDVYVPGIGGAAGITHNDIDVAHGDVNFVKGFMVQGAIWDGSSSATWTTAANWDTNVEPTSTTEVLFDLGIPGTGSTITLSSGRSASGVYFADSYTLSGGSLTLTDGRIDVDDTKTATIATALTAPNGFRKVGLGTLNRSSGGATTVTGVMQVLQGTMNVSSGNMTVSGNLMVNPELTQKDKSLVAPFPTVAEITKSTLTINGGTVTAPAAYVGGTDTASGAIGTLNVSSGMLTIAGLLKIWNSSIVNIDSKVNLSGGTLSVALLNTDGDPASFNWTGGTLAVTGGGGFSVSPGGPLGSALTVGTGKTLNVTNTLTIGGSSTLTLQNTGQVAVGTLNTGGDPTRLVWTGGTFTHNGPGTSDLGTRTLGAVTGQTLNINGGTVTGSFTTQSPGFINVNAGGTLSAPTDNNGVFTVNGGTVTSSVFNNGTTFIIGATPSTFGVAATVDNPGVINVISPANVAFNAGVAGPGTITIAAGATMTTAVVASGTLNVDGSLTVNPDWPAAAAIAGDLDVTGTMDLKNNRMIVLSTPIGSWNGSAYTGITGMIQSGRGDGSWNGSGIVTSMSDATTGVLTTLAVALAEETPHAGGTFGGVSVNAGDTLVMYTWGGDADLNGELNGDDYFYIDSNALNNGSVFGFHNGDFDYNGTIDGDDYFIIDSNITFAQASPPFPTGASMPSLAAVPEPGTLVCVAAATLLLRRRRSKVSVVGGCFALVELFNQ